MVIEGWVHPVYTEIEAKVLVKFVDNHKELFLKHFAILYGILKAKNGTIIGQEGGKTLLIMYNSVEEFAERRFLDRLRNIAHINTDSLLTLNDIEENELVYINQDTEDEFEVGLKIKKADYVAWEEYGFDTDQIISDFFQGKELITSWYLSSE